MRDAQGRGVTGGRGAAPIWAEFMRRATEGEPAREFPVPADIRFRTINPLTGQAALPWESRRMEVALREGQDAGIRPAAETPPAPPEAPAPPAASYPDESPPDARSESPPVRPPGGGPRSGQSAGGASTGGYVGGH
jgi:membrane carboxypeptidase/penicillin-binding protein